MRQVFDDCSEQFAEQSEQSNTMSISSTAPPRIEWLLPTGIILTSLLQRPADAPEIKKRISRPWIPYGTQGWRLPGESVWKPLDDLPGSWGLAYADGTAVEYESEEEERRAAEDIWRKRYKGK